MQSAQQDQCPRPLHRTKALITTLSSLLSFSFSPAAGILHLLQPGEPDHIPRGLPPPRPMRLRRPAEPLRMPTESPAASAQVCERVQDKLGFRLPLRGRGHVRVPGRRAVTSPRGWARGRVEQPWRCWENRRALGNSCPELTGWGGWGSRGRPRCFLLHQVGPKEQIQCEPF